MSPDFDVSSWLQGPTGIGYGDGDDETVLADMRRTDDQPGYTSVCLRHEFHLTSESLAAVGDLILRVDYNDGFKACLNGTEIARANLPAGDVAYDATATASHEAGTPGVMFIAGGPVHGGVYNCDAEAWLSGDLFSARGRYLDRRTDFRAVFAEIFTRHLGASDEMLEAVIPGYTQAALENPADFLPLGSLPPATTV